MSELVPITPEKYGSRRWQRYTSYSFAATTSYAPLVGAELQRAMQNMPLAFIKQEQSFHIAAVLSLSPGGNLFVDPKGRWLGGYVPSIFRGYPFKLAKVREQDKLVLCVDEASGLISDTSGEPFFDENNDLAQPVREVLEISKQRTVPTEITAIVTYGTH